MVAYIYIYDIINSIDFLIEFYGCSFNLRVYLYYIITHMYFFYQFWFYVCVCVCVCLCLCVCVAVSNVFIIFFYSQDDII